MIFHLENKNLQFLQAANQKLRLMDTNASNQVICTLLVPVVAPGLWSVGRGGGGGGVRTVSRLEILASRCPAGQTVP